MLHRLALACLCFAATVHGMRVLLIQADNRPLVDRSWKQHPARPTKFMPPGFRDQTLSFVSMSAGTHYLYALRHGYDYVSVELPGTCFYAADNPHFRTELNHNWCKVWAMKTVRERLPGYDWYLYTDSDCLYNDEELSFEKALERFVEIDLYSAEGATVIVSSEEKAGCLQHLQARSTKEEECRVNSGIMLWRNTRYMQPMLDFWWQQAMAGDPYFRHEWPFEQGAFSGVVMNAFRGAVMVIPQSIGFINTPTGSYISHFWSGSDGVVKRDVANIERLRKAAKEGTFDQPFSFLPILATREIAELLDTKWVDESFKGPDYVRKRCLWSLHGREFTGYETAALPNLSPSQSACGLLFAQWPVGTEDSVELVVKILAELLPNIQLLVANSELTTLRPEVYSFALLK